MMVTLVGLLKDFHGLPLTDYEVGHLAYVVERQELGLKGGLQDQYAATFGGFNYIEFSGDQVIVNPLRIRSSTLNELEHNLLLCYSGQTRPSEGIIDDQTSRYEEHDEAALTGLRMQKALATEMKNALLRGRLSTFGSLLDQAWHYKKLMSPKISTPLIDEAYEEAMRHGALGGKVMGAGGGGHLLFYCDYRKRHLVGEALTRLGMSVVDFAFDPEGLRTWRVDAE
jgi:D-glycero-alpha-D-manno-heptose-7-phosphate kinase